MILPALALLFCLAVSLSGAVYLRDPEPATKWRKFQGHGSLGPARDFYDGVIHGAAIIKVLKDQKVSARAESSTHNKQKANSNG